MLLDVASKRPSESSVYTPYIIFSNLTTKIDSLLYVLGDRRRRRLNQSENCKNEGFGLGGRRVVFGGSKSLLPGTEVGTRKEDRTKNEKCDGDL